MSKYKWNQRLNQQASRNNVDNVAFWICCDNALLQKKVVLIWTENYKDRVCIARTVMFTIFKLSLVIFKGSIEFVTIYSLSQSVQGGTKIRRSALFVVCLADLLCDVLLH